MCKFDKQLKAGKEQRQRSFLFLIYDRIYMLHEEQKAEVKIEKTGTNECVNSVLI